MLSVIDCLGRDHGAALSSVEGIGLSGQMHGAVLLDESGAVLRPAILWNDVRATTECAELETSFPTLRQVTGNIAMPGFTAPKLLWVRRHEPTVFARVRKVLLPKAYIRYRLTGEMIEEMSDASGTLWLDVGARDWSDAALSATGLARDAMPRLVEGNARAGTLRPELAARWRMAHQPVLAGGAGDNAAGAVGLSAIRPGDAFVSLGTSGVLFAAADRFRPYPQAAVHAFCHAIPGAWHQMGVTLSAAASLAWWAGITARSEVELLAEVAMPNSPSPALFLPYLGGERTPHNDATIRGAFAGLSVRHRPTDPYAGGAGGCGFLVARLSGCDQGFGDAHRSGGRHRRRLALTHMDRHHCRRAERSAAPFAGGRTRRCVRRCAVGSDGRHRRDAGGGLHPTCPR